MTYQQPVDNLGENMISRSRHTDNLWKLDWHGTLSRQSHSEAHREPLKRLARGVLIAIGIALCSASPAGQATTLQQKTPFAYATSMIGEYQAECLFRIAIKESNIRYTAVNKSSGAYGAWQFLHSHAKRLDPYEQVLLAIDYSNYRYGSPCKAWSFWQRNYWW
jgi:hypothetical protein